MIGKNHYLNWQRRLSAEGWQNLFWRWWGIYSVIFFFALGLVLLLLGRWQALVPALLALVLGRLVISPTIYLLYKKKRPCQVLGFAPLSSPRIWLFSRPPSRYNSFPSDHAVSFAALSMVFFLFFPVLGVWLLLLTLMNGWARIVLGYHYLVDVIFGWLVGILCALFVVWWLLPRLFTI